MSPLPMGAVAGLLLLGALAGCLDTGADDPPVAPAPGSTMAADWFLTSLPHRGVDGDHDHQDPTQHENKTTPNFDVIGWDPIATQYHGGPSGSASCGEVAETEGRTLAAFHSFNSDIALHVVDFTDPADPELIGELALPLTHVYDTALTDDGRYAILATSPLDTGPDGGLGGFPAVEQTYTTRATWTNACGHVTQGPEENLPFASGTLLVDLTDPTTPVIADFVPNPIIGPHSVSEATIDGTPYVAASITNLAHPGSYFVFYNIGELPTGAKLEPYGVWDATYPDQDGATAVAGLNGHVDATVQRHPVTGQVLAHLANWQGGYDIVELVQPGVILPMGHYGGLGAIHSTLPLDEMWGDRHITVIGQEGGRPDADHATGYVALIDTTDPLAPEALAWWTLPFAELQWDGGLMFSTHYVEMVGTTLFTSLYHGGLWAANASEEHWPALPTTGVFIPTPQGDMEPPAVPSDAPEVMDVHALADGTLVVMDGYSGAFTARFDPGAGVPMAPPNPAGAPWFQS